MASNPTAEQKTKTFQKKDSSYGASCSSFYTTEERRDKYETLQDVLDVKCSDLQIRQVIKDLMAVCADITEALRKALVTVEGSTNDFGDSQLSVDVRTNSSQFRLFLGSSERGNELLDYSD